jgi:hypothetical protein
MAKKTPKKAKKPARAKVVGTFSGSGKAKGARGVVSTKGKRTYIKINPKGKGAPTPGGTSRDSG